jgi:peptide/nickel transport system substrate-binding protein
MAGWRRIAAMAGVAAWLASGAAARDLIMGMPTDPTSIDPHYADLGPNYNIKAHIFDHLLEFAPDLSLKPGLAESWTLSADSLLWEFKLRRGITFHDGTPFTAEDVKFSLERAPGVPSSPSTFKRRLVDIKEVVVVDDHTLRIHAHRPSPALPNNLATIAVLNHKIGMGALPVDFNNGKHAIGTGPYKFVEFIPGNQTVFAANPDYWGEKPRFGKVTMKLLSNSASRLAALLAGDVDVIAEVPTTDVIRLEAEGKVTIARIISARVMFWQMDVFRDASPHITANDGGPIRNPFLDRRVREAVALAIDKKGIVDRVMEGVAEAGNQIVSKGIIGYTEALPVTPPNLARARQLMAEAGLADGFKVTIHATNNRYVNDGKQALAVAQMLARLNIKVNVAAIPVALYFAAARKNEFSFMLVGWGNLSGDSGVTLREALQSQSVNNYGKWVSPEFDRLIVAAESEVDDAKRGVLLGRAAQLGVEDFAIIPTHFQVNVWATKKGLRYIPRVDEQTLAQSVVIE